MFNHGLIGSRFILSLNISSFHDRFFNFYLFVVA